MTHQRFCGAAQSWGEVEDGNVGTTKNTGGVDVCGGEKEMCNNYWPLELGERDIHTRGSIRQQFGCEKTCSSTTLQGTVCPCIVIHMLERTVLLILCVTHYKTVLLTVKAIMQSSVHIINKRVCAQVDHSRGKCPVDDYS